ncbi:MAG TPA: heme-copper oxidase subunit III [Polyangia bacterium]|nr:heme-copper oxidase subunit III [Polyangia bacterium]
MSEASLKAAAGARVHAPSRVGVAGMWAFLATDAMGFGGLFVAYGVLRVRAAAWPAPRAHLSLALAAAMTFALLASAFTVDQAARAASPGGRRAWLAATIALGLGFLGGEAVEYRRLAAEAVRLRGGDLFAGTFYALTGYHGLHVLAGVICLLALALGGARARALEVAALYWQFVDLAWMPIFTFLYLMPAR